MTVERIFNNIYFNIFILFINTSVIDAFYKALHIPAQLISIIRLLTNLIFILMVLYYVLTARLKNRKYILSTLFILFAGITIIWTVHKGEAVKLYINFLGACCYFVLLCCMSYKEKIMDCLKRYSTVIIIANVLALTILPGVGYMGDETVKVLSGIHLSRSALIVYMNFSIFIYVYYLKTRSMDLIKELLIWLMILIAAAIIVLSKSSTGIITVVLFIPLLSIAKHKRRSKLIMKIALIIAVILPFIKMTSSFLNTVIMTLFKKNLTFSGRTYIWQYALDKLINNPVIGNGFNSTSYEFANKVIPIYDRVAAHAHNGFLQIYMELGMIGMIMIVIILIAVFGYTFRIPKKDGVVVRAYLVVFIIFNFMEPYTIGNVSLIPLWLPIVYVITLASGKMRECHFIPSEDAEGRV